MESGILPWWQKGTEVPRIPPTHTHRASPTLAFPRKTGLPQKPTLRLTCPDAANFMSFISVKAQDSPEK